MPSGRDASFGDMPAQFMICRSLRRRIIIAEHAVLYENVTFWNHGMNFIFLLHISLYCYAVVFNYLPVYSDPVVGHVFQESLNLWGKFNLKVQTALHQEAETQGMSI